MNTTKALNLPLRSLLFGDLSGDESAAVLTGRMNEDNVRQLLRDASPALVASTRGEVGNATNAILSIDAFDAIAVGWRKHRLLTEAAERTAKAPGSREVVELASHRITANYEPRVDVYVDGVKAGQIDLTLELSANAIGVCAVVTAGRLVALRSGHIDLAANLRGQGIELAKGERRIDIGAEVSLGNGISLTRGTADHDLPP